MAHIQSQALKVESADPEQARCAFKKCAGRDVYGLPSHLDATERGQCFKISGHCGQLFYSVFKNEANQLWIYAASGAGKGLTEAGFSVMEMQAKAAGCVAVAFQTVRRGLIAKAKKLGYQITAPVGSGFILTKAV